MLQPSIAFIGAGNMTTSLISGLLRRGHPAGRLAATGSGRNAGAQPRVVSGIRVGTDNVGAARGAEVVVIAVKPATVPVVLAELREVIHDSNALLVSIAAGVSIASMEAILGTQVAIMRCLPNTPSTLGCGASGLFGNANVSPAHHALAEYITAAVGVSVQVAAEHELDTVTALSGSGPAYFFLLMEAMIDAAVDQGLGRDCAELLARHTALGAASLAVADKLDLQELRRRVSSPGGTTEQALASLESEDFRGMVTRAMRAAQERAASFTEPMAGPDPV